MPTLEQLPQATVANPQDLLLLDQNGQSGAVCVATLLGGTQPQLTLASGVLLGRVSIGPGVPEPVGLGSSLAIAGGQLVIDTNAIAPAESPSFTGAVHIGNSASSLGFFGASPSARPSVSGSRGGNPALASLLAALAGLGLVTDASVP